MSDLASAGRAATERYDRELPAYEQADMTQRRIIRIRNIVRTAYERSGDPLTIARLSVALDLLDSLAARPPL